MSFNLGPTRRAVAAVVLFFILGTVCCQQNRTPSSSLKNVLILSLPYPGHVRAQVELMDTLAAKQGSFIGNITLLNSKSCMGSDERLKEWYSRQQQHDMNTTIPSQDTSKIHLAFLDPISSNDSNVLNFIASTMESISKLPTNEGLVLAFQKVIAPYEKLMIESLEIVEMDNSNATHSTSNGRILNIIPFGDRFKRISLLGSQKASLATKTFLRIKNDPSQTLFEHVIIDFSLYAIQSIAAASQVACTKLYVTMLPHSLFHYPAFSADRLEYFTNFWMRLKLPYEIFKDVQMFSGIMGLLGDYFTTDEMFLSDVKCTRIQLSSLGFEFASASSQQLNTFLVGPFLNERQIESERQQLRALSLDENQKERGYFGLLEWTEKQQDVMLIILGSTMLLNEQELHKFLIALDISLGRNPQLSILLSLGAHNLVAFDALKQGSSSKDLISALETNSRFRKLNGFVPQKGLLSLEKIKIFLTHCGGNSVNEALYFGKLLIGVPSSFDQFRISVAIKEFQVGIPLFTSKEESKTWNVEQLSNAIQELLYSPQSKHVYASKARHVRALMRHSGGVQKAADIIEMMLELEGDLSWTTPDKHLKWWQYYWLDIVGVYLSLLGVVVGLVWMAMKRVLCQKRPKVKSN
ncbi:hypothetical protein C9374_013359 [Naegleria lovaniensis]|uniref:Uncharacterized protein n=1 Tax=Naegleria lovaniensis TaxID=51637 RepID=A0AA88GWL5_NAELO|nr:uncharacterized protein C9374_013359 [Naegleria lovaniensis]KAG2391874.1 hypothetical protein C9374_013359 [Naegleria lovaniensis]